MGMNQSISAADKSGIFKVKASCALQAGDVVTVSAGGEYAQANMGMLPYYWNGTPASPTLVQTLTTSVAGGRSNGPGNVQQRVVAELGDGTVATLQYQVSSGNTYVVVSEPGQAAYLNYGLVVSGTGGHGNIHRLTRTTFGIVSMASTGDLTLKIYSNLSAYSAGTVSPASTVTIATGMGVAAQLFDSTILYDGTLAVIATYGTTTNLYRYSTSGTLLGSVTVAAYASSFVALCELANGGVAVQHMRSSDSFMFVSAFNASLGTIFAPVNTLASALTYTYATRGQTLIELDNGHIVALGLSGTTSPYFFIYTSSGASVYYTSFGVNSTGIGAICPASFGFMFLCANNAGTTSNVYSYTFEGLPRYGSFDIGVSTAGGANSIIANSFVGIVRLSKTTYAAISSHYYVTTPATSIQTRLITEGNTGGGFVSGAIATITNAAASTAPQGQYIYLTPSKLLVTFWGVPGLTPGSMGATTSTTQTINVAGVALDTVNRGQTCRLTALGTHTTNDPALMPLSFSNLSLAPRGAKGYINGNTITMTAT